MNALETLIWYGENILDYAMQMLPCMGLGLLLFLAAGPWRRRRLVRLGLISPRRREMALLLFVLFCAGLGAVTLFPAEFWRLDHWVRVVQGTEPLYPNPVDWRIQLQNVQINPLQEILRAFRGPWVMFLMLANIGIFIPIGFAPAMLWRNGRLWKAVLMGFGTSLFIETVQLFLPRSSDVDDLILNTGGAVAGYLLSLPVRKLLPGLTASFQVQTVQVPDGQVRAPQTEPAMTEMR